MDGKVKLSFHINLVSSYRSFRYEDSDSNPNMIDLGRIFQIFFVIDIPIKLRYTTSIIPNPILINIDYTSNIPRPIYTNLIDKKSEQNPSSLTFSVVTKNTNELNVIEKEFYINKKLLHNNFYSQEHFKKREWFFKNLLDTKKQI